MFNFPDPKTKNPKGHAAQRMLEVIPGLLTWFTIIGMFVFSVYFSYLGGDLRDHV